MRLILLILFNSLLIGCDRTSINDVDLIGEWLLLRSCDSCLIYEFDEDYKLFIRETNDESFYQYNYKFYTSKTIGIFNEDYNGIHTINIYRRDSIEIMGFTLSGIPEEMNSLLKRIH